MLLRCRFWENILTIWVWLQFIKIQFSVQVEIRIFGFTGKWLILAWENLYKLPCSRFPTGKQHYDMLRTQERNSVAVLYQVNSLHICSFPLWYLTILCFLLTEVSSLSDVVTSFIWTDLFFVPGSPVRHSPISGEVNPALWGQTLQGRKIRTGKVKFKFSGADSTDFLF